MNEKRREQLFGVIIAVWVFLLCVLTAVILVRFSAMDPTPGAAPSQPESIRFEDWQYLSTGENVRIVTTGEPYVRILVPDGHATVTHTVDRDMPEGTFFTLRACITALELRVNDRPIYTYQHYELVSRSRDPYATRMYWIPLPELSAGDVLTLSLSTQEPVSIPIQYMLAGTEQQIAVHIMETQILTLVTMLSLLVFSFSEITMAVIRRRMHSNIFSRSSAWIGSLIFFAAVWLGSNSGLFLVLIRNSFAYYLIEMFSLAMIPFCGTLYLYYNGESRPRFLRMLCFEQMAGLLIGYLLFLFGFSDFGNLIPFIHVAIAIVVFYMLYAVLSNKTERDLFFLIGTFLIVLVCVVSLLLYYARLFYPISQLAKYGMLAFSVSMLFYSVTHAVRTAAVAETAVAAKTRIQMVEDELFLSQISSHFFYNTMNIIRGLIKIDADAAYELTGNFVKYLRAHVDAIHVKGGILPFPEELAAVRAFGEVSRVKLNGNLEIIYDLDVTNFIVPALTLEPIVENAIKHGLFPKGGGCVYITTRAESDAYLVTVRDDGVGFDTLQEGVGLSSVRRRLQRYDGCDLTLDSYVGHGTVVTIKYAKTIDTKEILQDENDAGR